MSATPFSPTPGTTSRVDPAALRLLPEARNPRRGDVAAIASSLRRHSQYKPVTVNVGTHTGRAWEVLAGNHTVRAFRDLAAGEPDAEQWRRVAVFWVDVDDDMAQRIVIADNQTGQLGGFDTDALADIVAGFGDDLDGLGFTDDDLASLSALHEQGNSVEDSDGIDYAAQSVPLSERYGIPPFSVLDRRSGPWRQRRREWIERLPVLDSADGRAGGLTYPHDPDSRGLLQQELAEFNHGGTSVFDPVLCELAYRWHTPLTGDGATVLDPFAGGSVRGLIASHMGLRYTGIDVRPEQVTVNESHVDHASSTHPPQWVVGDSRDTAGLLGTDYVADFLFSCPPYADLETYDSGNPGDISALDYDDFGAAYRSIIAAGCAKLRDNRFAAWVVSDTRDSRGRYRGLVHDTVVAFADAGLYLLNEYVITDPIGMSRLRVRRQFDAGRKAVRTHQFMLVFVKGDVRTATAWASEGRQYFVPDDDDNGDLSNPT